MARKLIINEFRAIWLPFQYSEEDIYSTKYKTPELIRLKPYSRMNNFLMHYHLIHHKLHKVNCYTPFRFKKRYKVILEPWHHHYSYISKSKHE